MRVRSIGWQTDLHLRELEGAEIIEREDHLLVRTVANPSYRWGNFLLFDPAPRDSDPERWITQFQQAFPNADYVAIGLDSPDGEHRELPGLGATGLTAMTDSVLIASELRAPPLQPPRAVFREVRSEEDWQETVRLRLTVEEGREGSGYLDFLERQMQAVRSVCERGLGAWFGAYRGGEMCSSLGIFNAGGGIARFQNVDTHPAHRKQGLASNLLVAAAAHAQTRFATDTLVIAADPDYLAIDIYRSLGFKDREQHVQLERLLPTT